MLKKFSRRATPYSSTRLLVSVAASLARRLPSTKEGRTTRKTNTAGSTGQSIDSVIIIANIEEPGTSRAGELSEIPTIFLMGTTPHFAYKN